MNKRITGFVLLAALIGIFYTVGFAADITSGVEIDNGIMHIYGEVDSKEQSEVLVRVVNDTGNAVQMEDIVYIEQKAVNDDGSFDFYFELPETDVAEGEFVPAKYRYAVGIEEDSLEFKSGVIEYYGVAYQKSVIQKLNAAKAEQIDKAIEEIKSVLQDSSDKLYIGADIYNTYIHSHTITDSLAAYFAKLPELSEDNVTELKEQLNEAAAVSMLRDIRDSSVELSELFEDSPVVAALGLADSSAMKTYDDFKNVCGAEILLTYASSEFKNASESKAAFEFAAVSCALKESLSASQVESVLTANEAILEIDVGKYDLTNEELMRLAGIDIDNLTDVKDRIKDIINSRNGNGGNSGSSGGGNPSVSNPGGNIIIPLPVDEEADIKQKKPFNDLEGYEWAEPSIEALFESGVIKGKGEKIFAPNDVITREEFLQMLVIGLDIKYDGEDKPIFADVDENQWYTQSIYYAYSAGIIKGISENEFGIGAAIKREDAAVMAYRALQKFNLIDDSIEYVSDFTDGDMISEYADQPVAAMQHIGVISGYETGEFRPYNSITRAEAAVIIKKLTELKADTM